MFNHILGIDLGTSSVLIYLKGKGIVLNEPSVVAFNKAAKTVIAAGSEAQRMEGKTPPGIETIRPLKNGVISDYTMAEAMIKAFLGRAAGRLAGNIKIMMCVPSGVTDVEQRAVIETAREIGAKEIYIMDEPVAAAMGAGIDVSRAYGAMVADIGGGTTDIAVISMGKIIAGRSMKIAGDAFTDAVERFMKREYNMIIGPQTAEYLKTEIGCVCRSDENPAAVARGLSTVTGLPKRALVSADELRPAFEELVHNIVERILDVLEESEPQLQSDILRSGILLTGGGSMIRGLDERITEASGVKAFYAEHPQECVAVGAGAALDLVGADDIAGCRRFYKKAYIH